MQRSFDVVVIGTGEAGAAAALRCRADGRSVAVVDSLPYIAFEFGHIAARAGAAVTIVHRGARPLEHFDKDLVARLVERSREVGIDVRTNAKGLDFDVKQGDTSGWYSARRVAEPASMFKVLIEKGSGRLLGAHVLEPEADEFTNIFTLAIQAGISADALRQMTFVYPTQASNMAWML